MGIFDKLKEPVFLKENSNAETQVEILKTLMPQLNQEGQAILKQDIKNLEYGIAGEKQIAFELKNSHMPMYILHDIYLEDGELSAQIDYLVFTRKMCFVMECKNLYGNIEINHTGDFIRTIQYGNKWKKEGIYSPITQNQRHLELIKKIRSKKRNNFISKMMLERNFDNFYQSVVVLANPKTVLNAKYAKKEIKQKVIRADQLIPYIKDRYNQSKELTESDESLLAWAKSYLALHKEVEKDYTKKFDAYKIELPEKKEETIAVEDTEIFKKLKKYRLEKSREEQIKPYYIFNDNQLKDLISKMPGTPEELMKVSGFGEGKVGKYGDEILKIMEEE